MSDIIHLLPDSIANQIAAGEVIQRPASVVKELTENAIDAGAKIVRVLVKDAGKTLIQVIDDGRGMSETDARMAFERHATSKISSADDLFTLHTMGFRGEALASIAAVAHVELKTRLSGDELGTKLVIAGSKFQECEPEACSTGSSFCVKNLFFNVPARRKFLKSNETEFRNIVTEFERVALVNPDIDFVLIHNDIDILNLPASNLRQRIINIYGKVLNQKLLALDVKTSLVEISGFIGRPDSAKKRGALQFFFVNGRFMKHSYFHKAVMSAYEQLIPVGEMPSYFIYLTLDPSTIDVNIHPTKTEIKFENEQAIWQILMAAIKESLAKSNSIPSIDFDVEDPIEIPVFTVESKKLGEKTYSPPDVHLNSSYDPFNTVSRSSDFDWEKLYQGFAEECEKTKQRNVCEECFNEDSEISDTQSSTSTGLFSDTTVPCYQYKSRYIITSLKSGLLLIDQRRAHIRVLYDQYIINIRQQQLVSQQMLFPEIVELMPEEEVVLSEIMEDLKFAGFDLSNLGNNSYAINGLPAGIDNLDPVLLVRDILAQAREIVTDIHEKICEILALSLAKVAAIPYGKFLSAEEMDHILASLFSSSFSDYTPDGKKIVSILTDDDLEKRFK